MRTPFKLYREDEKTLAPVINIGTSFRPPGVFLVERDINFTPNNFESLKQNRFLMIFPSEFNIPEYFVKNLTRPSCQINNGMIRWDDVVVTFHDPISPSLQKRFYQIMTNLTSNNHHFQIKMLDNTHNVVSEWSFYGSISRLDSGSLSYDSHYSTELKLTIMVNSAELLY